MLLPRERQFVAVGIQCLLPLWDLEICEKEVKKIERNGPYFPESQNWLHTGLARVGGVASSKLIILSDEGESLRELSVLLLDPPKPLLIDAALAT